MRSVLLLMPTTSYRAHDLLEAARRLEIDVIVGTDRKQALEELAPAGTITIAPDDVDATVERAARLHAQRPLDAVIGVDDETVVVAAEVATRLGLRANAPAAVRACRDKLRMRRRLEAAGAPGPTFRAILASEASRVAAELPYPCVVKPLSGSASRGVLRIDDAQALDGAVRRIVRLLGADMERTRLLVESYLPGDELAVEGLLTDGRLRPLALFDKPDPLVGPTFEETIYTTPSRRSDPEQAEVIARVQEAVTALGLRHGPIHAEVRLADGSATLLEIAPRTIGGLCGRSLCFDGDASLEELVLRDAVGDPVPARRNGVASGVMMIPIAGAGILRRVAGVERARAISGIRDVTISALVGQRIEPPPEGDRYLGFIFAETSTPAEAEAALRTAHAQLRIQIEG